MPRPRRRFASGWCRPRPTGRRRRLPRQAERIAAAAESKTEQAEADRREKGKAYEGDELFQYLWRRGYGTAEYRAGPLTRLFDGWIARFIGFREARASFAMLNEIPRRLGEHAERRRAQAVAERERLSAHGGGGDAGG